MTDRDVNLRQRLCSTNAALLDPARFGWTASGGVGELLHPRMRTQTKSSKKSTNASRATKKRCRREAFSNTNGSLVASEAASLPLADTGSDRSSPANNLQICTTQSTRGHNGVSNSMPLETHDTGSSVLLAHAAGSAGPSLPIWTVAKNDDEMMMDAFHYDDTNQIFDFFGTIAGKHKSDAASLDSKRSVHDVKSMTATVTIEFRLGDEADHQHESNILGHRYYREKILWNLADEETVNPMVFATELSREFGLSYSQTWELAESIQAQLQSFVQDNFAQTVPTIQSRDLHPSTSTPMVPLLYGEVTGLLQQGGSSQPYAPKPKEPPCSQVSSLGPSTSVPTSGKPPAKQHDSADTLKVEYIFYSQVRERLQQLLVVEIRDNQNSAVSKRDNHFCHLCHEARPICGVFACGLPSHAYCVHHLSEQLGLTDPSELQHIEHCPICTLACTCAGCSFKLDTAAFDFKSKCIQQVASPDRTVFADLLTHCRGLSSHADQSSTTVDVSKKQRPAMGARHQHVPRVPKIRHQQVTKVPKVPLCDFYREVYRGIDVGSLFEKEYRALYNGSGLGQSSSMSLGIDEANSLDTTRLPSPFHDEEPVEDGSVDFCNVCKKVGNILCCDFCPRAFHNECIPLEASQTDSAQDTKWECPACCQEKNGLAADSIDGSRSIAIVRKAYKCADDRDSPQLTVLSILHEMIHTLMEFDFGYMFQSPVDCEEIPSYSSIVKHPMDLGTVSTNLLRAPETNGSDAHSIDDTVLAVLKDIELIWHNCFIFNVEGSAVYRMAEVQKRRADNIRKRSLDHCLSDEVKRNLSSYVAALTQERDEYRRLESPVLKRKVRTPLPPEVLSNGIGSLPKLGKSRPVAVVDNETGKVLKMYSSLQASCDAIRYIFGLKRHSCEFEPSQLDSPSKVRRTIVRCQEDPNHLLFGYRWVYLDKLQNGKVALSDASTAGNEDPMAEIIEMVDAGVSFFFNSIAEALSFPGLSDDLPDLLNQLMALPLGADLVEVAGRKWRRLRRPDSRDDAAAYLSCVPGVKFVKEDAVFGSTQLAGFPHVKAAYQDWCQSVDASVAPFTLPKSFDTFYGFYLNSDRAIDGVKWRQIPQNDDNGTATVHDELLGTVTSSDPRPLDDSFFRDSSERATSASSATEGLEDDQASSATVTDEKDKPVEDDSVKDVKIPAEESLASDTGVVNKRLEEPVEHVNVVVIAGSQEAASTTGQSITENSRGSKVFDLEAVLPPKQSYQKSLVFNGLSENCNLSLHVPARDDGIEVIGRRDAATLG